jgi:hypothetical protein
MAVMRDAVDNEHFGRLHGVSDALSMADADGASLNLRTTGRVNTGRFFQLGLTGWISLRGLLQGPGLLTYHAQLEVFGFPVTTLAVEFVTPLEPNRCQMLMGSATKRYPVPGMSNRVNRMVLDDLMDNVEVDRLQWEGARLAAAVTELSSEAALFSLFDRWFSQFQHDTAVSA